MIDIREMMRCYGWKILVKNNESKYKELSPWEELASINLKD